MSTRGDFDQAATKRAMAVAGCTPQQMADVVAIHEKQIEEREQAQRERQAAHRKAREEECAPSDWYALRAQVFERDEHTCVYCGASDEPLHCDHIMPFSRGGKSELSNLATACGRCNASKHNKTIDEWRASCR